ncbi:MAG: hypothetical protein ACE5DM_04610, partial [Candidatus Nanoarchaeia archaeon]
MDTARTKGGKVPPAHIAILQTIFEDHLKVRPDYSRGRSYVRETVRIVDQYKRERGQPRVMEYRLKRTLGDEAHLMIPAYQDYIDVIFSLGEAIDKGEVTTEEFAQSDSLTRFVNPLKQILGILTPQDEEVLGRHIKHNIRKKGKPDRDAEADVRKSNKLKTAFLPNSQTARTILKAFLHECYADDGRIDSAEFSTVAALGQVMGGLSEEAIQQLDDERQAEDNFQRAFVPGYIKNVEALKAGLLSQDRFKEQIAETQGPSEGSIARVYCAIRDCEAEKRDLEDFLLSNDADFELPYNAELISEEDIVYMPQELVTKIRSGTLSERGFRTQIMKYCYRGTQKKTIIRNILRLNQLINVAHDDGEITGQEYYLLAQAAQLVYGVRDSLVFEQLLSQHNRNKRVVVCVDEPLVNLGRFLRDSGYQVTWLELRNLLGRDENGATRQEWLYEMSLK